MIGKTTILTEKSQNIQNAIPQRMFHRDAEIRREKTTNTIDQQCAAFHLLTAAVRSRGGPWVITEKQCTLWRIELKYCTFFERIANNNSRSEYSMRRLELLCDL